jgi:Carboxypeptidase regulatory-like domain/TonB dependent receptor
MRLIKILLLSCVLAATMLAQGDRGTITGTISDPQGAVVASAPIEARHVETAAVFTAATSATGNYNLSQLPVGTYSLTVTVPGFKKYVRSNILIEAAQTARVDVVLEIGAANESVTVTETAPLLKTESGELSQNISTDQLNNLPMLGIGATAAGTAGIRNPYSVIQLLPGSATFGADSSLRLNGSPSNTEALRIDGQDATNGYSATQSLSAPSVDAIEEFAVETSNFAAEFGQVGGGLFNVTMKSGSNQFHGSVYDYFVNEALNAGTPNTNNGNNEHIRNRQRRNDYGFTLGGPVRIPKLYDGRNKLFFFFSFEQFRETTINSTTNYTVPIPAYQSGNFTQALTGKSLGTDPLGRPIMENTIYDPTTDRIVNGLDERDPFPNNTVPLNQQDPVALKIQSLIPQPNRPGLINNFVPTYKNSRLTYVPSIKIDYSLSSRSKLSGYYSYNYSYTPNNNGFPGIINGTPTTNTAQTIRINFDETLSPTLLFHLGVGLLNPTQNQEPPAVDPVATLGFKGSNAQLFPYIETISGNQGGGPTLGPGQAVKLNYTKPTATTSLTWVRNNHTYKAGAEVILNGYVAANRTYANTWVAFSPNETGLPSLNGVSLPGGTVGFAYASFLMGRVDNGYAAVPTKTRMGSHGISGFVQDSWKMTRKLTLDYGLRYDFQTYLSEEHGRYGVFSPSTANPSAGGLLGALIFEGDGGGRCNCRFAHNYPWAFGPRIGLAYQVIPKTVFRAGIGVAYNKPDDNNSLSLSTGSQQIYSSPSYGNPAYLMQNGVPYTITWPNFNPGQIPLPGTTSSVSQLFDPQAGRPARQLQWSIGIQREITHDLVLEADFVGNRGVWWNAPFLINPNILTPQILAAHGLNINSSADLALLALPINSATAIARGFGTPPYAGFPLTATVAQAIRPFPQFGSLNNWHYAPLGDTWYDALQVKATKRLSHGLSAAGSFSWQKQMDIGVEEDFSFFNAISAQVNDIANRPQNKYLSGYDQPMLLVISGNYTTPGFSRNKVLSWVVRDWTLGALLRYSSGLPIPVPTANNALSTVLFRSTYADRVPGQPLFLQDLNCHCFDPTTTLVLNPAAWANPPAGQFGTSAAYYSDYRYQRRPAESMSLGREFRIKERAHLQIRAEFTNIFNRLVLPNPSVSNAQTTTTHSANGLLSAGFGFINTTNGAGSMPRAGTLVARFSF